MKYSTFEKKIMTTTISAQKFGKSNPKSSFAFLSKIDNIAIINGDFYFEKEFNHEELLFQNIMISVLIKEIYCRKEISEFEKSVFKQSLKDETVFKVKIEDASSTFYNDFIIDNLKTTPTTKFASFVEETHLEFEKFMKSKSLSELRIVLKFLNQQNSIN